MKAHFSYELFKIEGFSEGHKTIFKKKETGLSSVSSIVQSKKYPENLLLEGPHEINCIPDIII